MRPQILLLAVVALPAGALGQELTNWKVGVGPYFPVEVSKHRDVKMGIAASIQGQKESLVAALDLAWYGAKGNQTIFVALPSIGYRYEFKGSPVALTGGVGPIFSWNSKGRDFTDLGFVLSVRVGDQRHQHAELRRLIGPKEGQDGFSIQILFPVRL